MLTTSNVIDLTILNAKNKETFIKSENSETNESHRLLLNLKERINLKPRKKKLSLADLGIYYRCRNIKRKCKNNKHKVPTPG